MKSPHSICLGVVTLMLSASGSVVAQGTAFAYHGHLADQGRPADGTFDLRFSLFDATNDLNQVGSTLTNVAVAVSGGRFGTLLDFGAGIFTGPERWLEIGVRTNGADSFTTLSPRQLLAATPYAMMANTASNLAAPLPASQLSGIIPDTQLSANIPRLDAPASFTGTLSLNNPDNRFSGDGAGLTGVNAAALNGIGPERFWHLGGNPGTTPGVDFLGTTDRRGLELKVNGQRAFRLEPTLGTPNVVGGSGSASSEDFPDTMGVTIGGGANNRVTNDFTTISGGRNNFAGGFAASVLGGEGNAAVGNHSTIAGGEGNSVRGYSYQPDHAVIGGGGGNAIAEGGWYASIGGGYHNEIGRGIIWDGAPYALIAGGASNLIHGSIRGQSSYSTIGGGYFNSITAREGNVIAGGVGNLVDSDMTSYSTIGGGRDNEIGGRDIAFATVGGGDGNWVEATGATIAGGSNNKIIGGFFNTDPLYSSIGGGTGNSIEPHCTGATVAGGVGNQIAQRHSPGSGLGSFAAIGGGRNNFVTAPFGTIAGGTTNLASGYASTVPGGIQAVARSHGQMAYASGQFAQGGDAQTSVYVLRGVSTNAAETELFLDGVSARMTIPTNTTWGYDILITARAANGVSAVYVIRGMAQNDGGTTTLSVTPTKDYTFEQNTAWNTFVDVHDDTDSLVVRVAGSAGTPIRWVAKVQTVEVGFQ